MSANKSKKQFSMRSRIFFAILMTMMVVAAIAVTAAGIYAGIMFGSVYFLSALVGALIFGVVLAAYAGLSLFGWWNKKKGEVSLSKNQVDDIAIKAVLAPASYSTDPSNAPIVDLTEPEDEAPSSPHSEDEREVSEAPPLPPRPNEALTEPEDEAPSSPRSEDKTGVSEAPPLPSLQLGQTFFNGYNQSDLQQSQTRSSSSMPPPIEASPAPTESSALPATPVAESPEKRQQDRAARRAQRTNDTGLSHKLR